MVLWQHVMLCGNTLLRVQLAGCASLCYVMSDIETCRSDFKCFYVEFM